MDLSDVDPPDADSARDRIKWVRRAGALLLALAVLLGGLFTFEGLRTDLRTPDVRFTDAPAAPRRDGRVRVLTWNLAKASFHHGGIDFDAPDVVRARLDAMADVMRSVEPDLVFLTEVVAEAAPCDVDQIEYLAEGLAMHAHVYGTNYSFGVPGYRIRAGNAILARVPLSSARVVPLAGGGPFWNPTNRRTALFAEAELGARAWTLGCVRNDSFDLANNRVQVDELLAELGDRPALLAGDFNATPETASIQAFATSGRFAGAFEGPPTYPTGAPSRRIDYIFAPAGWVLVSETVLDARLSDHLPVLAEFELPADEP